MPDRTWLVVGGSGLIGWSSVRALRARAVPVVATSGSARSGFVRVDLRDDARLAGLIDRIRPAAVVVCAGATWADRCELEPDWATAMNVTAIERIRSWLRPSTVLAYLSSDWVFDGSGGPYREQDEPGPVNHYGRTKLLAEDIVCGHAEHLVIRTSVVYGRELREPGKNSLCQVLDALRSGRRFTAAVDELSTPTYAGDVGEAIVELVTAGARGVFHVAGPEQVSRYEHARACASAFGLDPDGVEPATRADLGRPARRPARGGLVSARAERATGRRFRGLTVGLVAARAEWGPDPALATPWPDPVGAEPRRG